MEPEPHPISVGAAPHLPAGILSPYSDGEREAPAAGFANRWRRRKGNDGQRQCRRKKRVDTYRLPAYMSAHQPRWRNW
ncbi:MAG: hypothetical protein EOQ50_30115 [Mesorhizobium sp.]|nr:MAG: hypothetical protein EOQ50_30115 [Mesorhizobium sp.]